MSKDASEIDYGPWDPETLRQLALQHREIFIFQMTKYSMIELANRDMEELVSHCGIIALVSVLDELELLGMVVENRPTLIGDWTNRPIRPGTTRISSKFLAQFKRQLLELDEQVLEANKQLLQAHKQLLDFAARMVP